MKFENSEALRFANSRFKKLWTFKLENFITLTIQNYKILSLFLAPSKVIVGRFRPKAC